MNCNTTGLEDRETILQQLSQRVSGFLNHKLFETNITIDIVTLWTKDISSLASRNRTREFLVIRFHFFD